MCQRKPPGIFSPRMLALCYGTRPQVIKASALRPALARLGRVHAVDTGQHYDHALNALLYEQLGVAPPDEFLEVGSGSHAEQTALILTRAEAVLARLTPRAVVVIGDTNSTLGVALAAAKRRIPVVHVEAGLRAQDRLMAEELNRRMVDAMASLLLTPAPPPPHGCAGSTPAPPWSRPVTSPSTCSAGSGAGWPPPARWCPSSRARMSSPPCTGLS